jgi:hypothetical protein
MGIFSRREQTTARDYPNAGVTVTGSATRFRRHKTSGARQAGAAAEAWEDRDRQQDKRGRWYRPAR